MVNKVKFKIKYPLEVFEDKTIDFKSDTSWEDISKRNIYCDFYKGETNNVLRKRKSLYLNLKSKVIEKINKMHPSLDVLNLSIFGSSLFSKTPGDFDFLAIVKGNKFSLEETCLGLEKRLLEESDISPNSEENIILYPVGISIKGVDNFTRGLLNKDCNVSEYFQRQIIDRTAISLFNRHIPLHGKDFKNNKREFLNNVYAQASDLLNNANDLFLEGNKWKFADNERSRKLLSRSYEALSYLNFSEKSKVGLNLRKEVYTSLHNGIGFSESKKLFKKTVSYYNEIVDVRKEK